ncbi:hypothetical protein GCM10023170_081720 [Phytohabitans houttuyneae]|jgi:hypothetical protein|uniref:Pepco domain-containing protein n=1 Tax=Phytohabitans houttuyneae TaxID=1076126 RepID=A0A6V8KSX7_9ACTN|nr:hypothetical protein Phou_095890 [Phytohabitans houttuyneae]
MNLDDTTDGSRLPFLVAIDDPADGDTMGIIPMVGREVALRWVPTAALRASLRETVTQLREVLSDAIAPVGDLKLAEAHLAFEVTASGGVQLIGTSQVGAKGAITLVFRS